MIYLLFWGAKKGRSYTPFFWPKTFLSAERRGWVDHTCMLVKSEQSEKIITILFFAQYFCRNKSSPIRTSHNNVFVARVFLCLDFAIFLFPQFLTSMLPFFRSFVKVVVTISPRDAFFQRILPKTAVLRTVFYCFCSLGAT